MFQLSRLAGYLFNGIEKKDATSKASEGLSAFLIPAFFIEAFLIPAFLFMLRVYLQAPLQPHLQAPLRDDLELLTYVAGFLLAACMFAHSSRSRARFASTTCLMRQRDLNSPTAAASFSRVSCLNE